MMTYEAIKRHFRGLEQVSTLMIMTMTKRRRRRRRVRHGTMSSMLLLGRPSRG
jgi:hypothetical protein